MENLKIRNLAFRMPATLGNMNAVLKRCEGAIAPTLADGDRVRVRLVGEEFGLAHLEFRLSRDRLNIYYVLAVRFSRDGARLQWVEGRSPGQAIESAVEHAVSGLTFAEPSDGWREDFGWTF